MNNYTPPAVLVSVDPGQEGATAVFRSGVFHAVTPYKVSGHPNPMGAMTALALSRLRAEVGTLPKTKFARLVLVVETQFLGNNPQTLMRIVENRMVWEQAGRMLGFEVVRTDPATWQADLCGIKRGSMKSEDVKPHYMKTAKQLGYKFTKSDEAAAILMAEHFLANDKYAQRTGAGR